MAGNPEKLVVSVIEPLGFRHGWAGEVNRRIAEAAQSARVELEWSWSDVDKVPTCPGWWEAIRTTELIPSNIVNMHWNLIVDIAKSYLEQNAVWGSPSPIGFVREYLSNGVDNDPLAAHISLMLASWPQIMDASRVSLGPAVESLSVRGVPLRGQFVDAIYGDCRLGVEVSWCLGRDGLDRLLV